MKLYSKIFTCLSLISLMACGGAESERKNMPGNPDIIPAAAGFDWEHSDTLAVQWADSVAIAMGGKRALDSARYLSFNFFGARSLFVDRFKKKVRIESKRTDLTVIADLEQDSGKVFMYGAEQTHPDSIAKFVDVAQSMEINDVYWLLFPFKLKDSGVTLTYEGKKETVEAVSCHVLQLTFSEVGDTPQNKYWAYVNPETHLIDQWDFYRNATDTVPAIVSPYKNYQEYNGIKISLDRGKYQFSEVAVFSEISDEMYRDMFTAL